VRDKRENSKKIKKEAREEGGKRAAENFGKGGLPFLLAIKGGRPLE